MGNLKSFGTATTPEEKAWEMEVRRKGQLAQAEKRHRKKALNDILDAILAMKCDTSALTDDYITETAQKLAAEKGESITLYEAHRPIPNQACYRRRYQSRNLCPRQCGRQAP